jgi:biotin synthase
MELWSLADSFRHYCVGNEVHLRGLIEISNCCIRQCAYCGLRAANFGITRYRMSRDEILECTQEAVRLGYGTIVMQAGEDSGLEAYWMVDLIETIKRTTPLAVTLSLGERAEDELKLWKWAGADRYLLRFETSDRGLYDMIHPSRNGIVSDRLAILRQLRQIGYEIGSGVMVGIPGQTYHSLANDLQLFAELDLDMIGIGPFIPHPSTPLGSPSWADRMAAGEQVPGSELMVYKMVALARILCPQANIPATTALATINKTSGRENGLQRGANVIMPNLTPTQYRVLYEIYPDKACINETARQCSGCLRGRIASIGRCVGDGPGGRRR